MAEELEIPPEFGGAWQQFVGEWCLNAALAHDLRQVARALRALCRLWPAEVVRLIADSRRGVGVVASAVELGSMLDACETADAFQEVFQRLKAGERSAYSELVLVTALSHLGYTARIAPPIGGHVLDAACSVDGASIFFEVVAPERSDASAVEQLVVNKLTEVVRQSMSKCRVEIEVFSPFSETDIPPIMEAIRSAPPSAWVLVNDKARLRRIDIGQTLCPTFDGDGVQIVLGGETTVQGESTGVIARWETSDARAKRVFNEEYHQFSGEVGNVLVVNVSAVMDGMKIWPSLMARLLQPARNRKVGAVVFFEQGLLGPPEAVRRRWRVLVNPHAYVPIPEALLTAFESLDESRAFGLPQTERLVAV